MQGGNDNFTRILLHMDGSDASTTFTDNNTGGSAHTWTAAGNAQIDTAIAKFSGAAGLFDGAGDFITTPDHADFSLGSVDFTADCWFNRAGGSGTIRFLCGQGDSAGTNSTRTLSIALNGSNVLVAGLCQSSTLTVITGTTAITAAGWHHAAFVRTGNTLRLFVDGVQEGGDVSFSGAVNDSTNAFGVGCLGELTTLTWNGSIDEFRLSGGVARWISNFTPPAAPYDIGFNADVGAFMETGVASTFKLVQPSAATNYSEAGITASFKVSLPARAAGYAVAGDAVTFPILFPAAPANHAFTGNAATFVTSIPATTVAYTVTASNAAFSVPMPSSTGAYAITANDATLIRDFEAWFPRPFDSDTWTARTIQSKTWTPATKQSETWTPS